MLVAMNLKYIFLPKPDAGESTAMKRVGLVCYWLGAVWFVSFFFVFVYIVAIETPVLMSGILDNKQMSTYLITSPDGIEYEVKGKGEREVLAAAKARQAKSSDVSAMSDEELKEAYAKMLAIEKARQRRRVAGAWEGIGIGALLFLGLGIPGFFVGRGLLFIFANR